MRNILNDETRLGQIKIRYGLRIAKANVVCGYIMQIHIERAVKEYVNKRAEGADTIISDICGYVRDMSDTTLEQVKQNLEDGQDLPKALFNHDGRQNKKIEGQILQL